MPTLSELSQSQQFDWGSIRWLVEPGRGGVERVSAGLLIFNAQSVQKEHTHAGYEQILYIVSGKGRHEVNGEVVCLEPGSLVHIPPFARHAMYNEGEEPLTLVSLAFPLRSQPVPQEQEKLEEEYANSSIWSFLDMKALGVLLEKLSQALGFRLSLVDTRGNTIVSSSNMPPFCTMLRDASKGRHCKKRLREAIKEGFSARKTDEKTVRSALFMCCNSIASILIPVRGNQSIAGYIKCGEVFFAKSDQGAMTDSLRLIAQRHNLAPAELARAASGVRVELKSVLYAAAEATLAIANYITEMAASAMRRLELDKSRMSLAEEQMASARLEKALREADFKLLQSQINPHFLFNTLNTVSQMAYVEGNHRVAQTLWSLSDLLRFTLRRSEELISLQEELKLLRDYVLIQQTRYGDRLTVDWAVEPGIEDALIPCILLQPLVENAIVHGLEPLVGQGRISFAARKEGHSLHFSIRDNGVGFSPQEDTEKTGHIGIASVRNRLRYYFADASSFSIESAPGKGTEVSIRMPVVTMTREGGSEPPGAADHEKYIHPDG
jgi:quercetin dioxygenase-like cupin family protein/two-component sensor histidine kinase/ligand-binding sensor protein